MKSIDSLLKNITNKKLLITFPHPDDETVMTAGLIQRAMAHNWSVKVICVTDGSMGEIHTHGQGRNIIRIRHEELDKAMKVLSVTDYEKLTYRDGFLKNSDNWGGAVTSILDDFRPGVVVSYGPDGVSGHPDHLALGKHVFQHWAATAKYQLLWPSFTGKVLAFLKQKTLTSARVVTPAYACELSEDSVLKKQKALKAHKSQKLDHPLEWLQLDPTEYFAVPDKKILYNFNYVDFDIGI